MKKICNFVFVIVFIIGCNETPPIIDFSEKNSDLLDTTYIVSPIPSSVSTMIFVEDLTGVRCSNCPKAAEKIKEIKVANPGNVVAIGAYPGTLKNFMDPWPGFQILNTTEADNIFVSVYGSPSAIPTGGVNRKVFPGETTKYVSYNKWSGYSDIIKSQNSPLKLQCELVDFDTTSRKARIRVKAIFTKFFMESLNLTVYLSEDEIISKQLMPDGKALDTYIHNHVLRKSVTPFNGITLKINPQTSGNYEAGRTFDREFETELSPSWKKDKCSFVILINRFDADSKEIIQAEELEIR